MTTLEEIQKEVKIAAGSNRLLVIEGYTSSEGGVYNYVVKLLPDGGYMTLVKESHAMLEKLDVADLAAKHKEAATIEDWSTAKTEQLASFNNTINPADDAPKRTYNTKIALVAQDGMFLRADEVATGKISVVVIKNLQVMSSSVVALGSKAASLPKGTIPRLKHIIRDALPVSAYIAQLNLSPDKVKEVRAAIA